jgi:hypothetical protein
MRYILAALVLFLVLPGAGMAHGGVTKNTVDTYYLTQYRPAPLQSTQAQTVSIPYTFNPIDYSSTATEDLGIDFSSVAFIDQVGSGALTLFGILDGLNILGMFVVLLLGVFVVAWVCYYVTSVQMSKNNPVERPYNGSIWGSSGTSHYRRR